MAPDATDEVNSIVARWRNLRWAPPLLSVILLLEIANGGANGWLARPTAGLTNLTVSGAILMTVKETSRVWFRIRTPFLLFVTALLWAALPRMAPASITGLLNISASLAPDRIWPDLAESVSRLMLVMAACSATYRLGSARLFVLWFAATGGIYAGWMIVTPLPWHFLAGTERGRFAATIGNWNAAGTYFGMTAVLCLAAILANNGIKRRGWHWLFAVPLIGSMLLCMATQSRSAFTLTAVALVIAITWNRRPSSLLASKRQILALVIPLAVTVMLVAYLGAEAIFPRYFTITADGLSRWDIITTYFAYTMETPWWGTGPGSFFEVNQAKLTLPTALVYWSFGAVHNAPLQIALENGWPTLFLLIAAITAISRDIVRRRWDSDDVGLIGALAIAVGASMVDIAWNVPAVGALSCILLGVLWGARRTHQPRPKQI